MTTESNVLDILSGQLREVQSKVIALFIPDMYPSNEYVLVMENNDDSLTCIEIGRLLGLQTMYIDQSQGRYIPFPEGKTLWEMMRSPYEFHDWFKSVGLK